VPKIAISYRRADTEVMAGRIRDRLADRYGEDAVFMDIYNIPFGKDFRVHISEEIVGSDLLLVVVGRRWLGAGRHGNRSIDRETDFVRFEVETALGKGVPIIPVLVDSASMPQPPQVPESLKDFAFLNAAPVDTGRDFRQQMERLISSIDQILPDHGVTSPATIGSDEKAAAPAAPAIPSRGGDVDLPDFAVFRDASFAPELVVVPAGEFMMGSPDAEEGGYENERPQHRVTIGGRFTIGRYPVTFDEYNRFCEANRLDKRGYFALGRGRRPVIDVSWHDTQAYLAWLSQETGRAYRLPSEAEWEYACRAGTTTRYSFGDTITPDDANYGSSGVEDELEDRASPVGAYPPNPWGLHDMHGNVYEWVEDDWHQSYQGAPSDGSAWTDTRAGRHPVLCVLRGGNWDLGPRVCRSASRLMREPGDRERHVGFRVARTLS
jgi:formylglycine-generating enzyme required for sulfatase activity